MVRGKQPPAPCRGCGDFVEEDTNGFCERCYVREESEVVNISDGSAVAGNYDVYIGRGNQGCHLLNTEIGERGWLGNPFTEEMLRPVFGDGWREVSCSLYGRLFANRIKHDEEFYEAIQELKGKVLGCWCKPSRCHGDEIIQLLEFDDILRRTGELE